MANYQEDATYSETGETFKDKDCRVLSLSLGREGSWEALITEVCCSLLRGSGPSQTLARKSEA